MRIAILHTDTPVPNVLAKRGSYGRIFHDTLQAVSNKVTQQCAAFESQEFDVVRGEYPPSITGYHAIIISGSSASVYENVDWIRRLSDYILSVYTTNPEIKFFGSCFGHQIICQSLLRDHGVKVEKNPNGWEVGVHEVRLQNEFREAFSDYCPEQFVPNSIKIQLVHADQVVLPSHKTLPNEWFLLGSSSICDVQGLYQPGRVLTLQGHFEFDRFINRETVKVFCALLDPATLGDSLEAIDKDSDNEITAGIVFSFLMEEPQASGLLTPPMT